MPQPQILFQTVHGSHLYGLAHEHSDYDLFVVTDAPGHRARQGFDADGTDRTRIGIDAFLERVFTGSHQSVEALFSEQKEWTSAGLKYRPMLDSIRVTGGEVFSKYRRTITSFAHTPGDAGFKRRRHAVRLAMNLKELRERGRFDPSSAGAEVSFMDRLATKFEGDELLFAINDLMAPSSWMARTDPAWHPSWMVAGVPAHRLKPTGRLVTTMPLSGRQENR